MYGEKKNSQHRYILLKLSLEYNITSYMRNTERRTS